MGIVSDYIRKNQYRYQSPYGAVGFSDVACHIDVEKSMKLAVVWACIKVITETAYSVPCIVYKKRQDGGKDRASEHPLYDLLHISPNNEMSSSVYTSSAMANVLTTGNSYSYLSFGSKGQVTEIYPIDNTDYTKISPVRDKEGKLMYVLIDRGRNELIPIEKICHIRGLTRDGILGLSPIAYHSETIQHGIFANRTAKNLHGQGLLSPGILEYPGVFGDDNRSRVDEIRKQFAERYLGNNNMKNVILLENGMKFNPLRIPANEAQFLESRRYTVEEIARIYRVPMHMIGDLSRSTNNNIEQQSLEFVMYTMLPWFKALEAEMNFKLLTKYERQQGYFIEYLIEGLLRGDAKTRTILYNTMRQNGVMNSNEIRERENMNPVEGGDKYLVNGNMIDVASIGKDTGEGGIE